MATACHSTGIPDIAVYMAAPQPLRWISQAASALPGVTGSAMVRKVLQRIVDAGPAGPDAAARRRGRSLLSGEVRDGAGQTAAARIETPEGYALTAITAWDIACRVASTGVARRGFRTPSMVLGADHFLGIAGTTRTEL